uniref:Amino acid permease/ SLC12A domain-containing protein n=1 Tax=Salarias fasciatus TaxID=181472 RepID=A0A672IE38_SALFA
MELRRSSFYSTMDLVPQLEHYASALPSQQARSRPSLEEVEVGTDAANNVDGLSVADGATEESPGPREKAPVRFGWVTGVMIRCMLNIWGVILFLRLSWITSQAGILLTWVIILMSVTVTSVTALSISAIATNGRVISGGAYFMISRTLGPEIGGPIGVVFSFANALACALNTVGFAEVVRDLLQVPPQTAGPGSVRSERRLLSLRCVSLCRRSSAWSWWTPPTTSYLFFMVLMVSLSNYFVGTIVPPSQEKQAQGIFGYHSEIFITNLKPNWRGPEGNFFQMFAIFFPSAIGILSVLQIRSGQQQQGADPLLHFASDGVIS